MEGVVLAVRHFYLLEIAGSTVHLCIMAGVRVAGAMLGEGIINVEC